jgi:hypothetical protein
MGPRSLINAVTYCSLGLLTVTGGFAQDQPPIPPSQQQDQAPHPWRPANDTDAQPAPDDAIDADQAQPNPAPPPPHFSQLPNPNTPLPGSAANPNYGSVPARLTIRPGAFVTVRMNQYLSSDRNQQGDAFFAALAEPIIVDGVVVAQRGQTVSGRVTEAQKAGRVEGTSRLGVELTGLTLVDGTQAPIQSQMINRTGSTSTGRDAGAVAGTTALGAAIGAGADWGRGAAIGAGAGAAAGIIGVLLTRGKATVIYPESVLTFRIESPVEIATDRAPQAFRYVEPRDYGQNGYGYSQRPAPAISAAPAPYPPGYYYGPSYYPYPYYWGSGFSVYFGPRFYGHRGYYRGGFRR